MRSVLALILSVSFGDAFRMTAMRPAMHTVQSARLTGPVLFLRGGGAAAAKMAAPTSLSEFCWHKFFEQGIEYINLSGGALLFLGVTIALINTCGRIASSAH